MSSTTRNFKSSKINVKNAFADKEANDKARALGESYKTKIADLKQAREDIAQLANKYLLKFDFAEVIENFEELNISSFQQKIEEMKILLGGHGMITRGGTRYPNENGNIVRALDEYNFLNVFKITPKQLDDNKKNQYQELRYSIKSTLEKFKLEEKTGLTFKEILTEMPKLKAALDHFLDTYSDILGMDPRSEAAKVKGYKEYASTILDKLKAGNLSGAAVDVIQDTIKAAGETIESAANTVVEAATNNVVTNTVASIWSYGASFFVKPADLFFNNMISVDQQKLSQAVLENEILAENAEELTIELDSVSSTTKVDTTKAVKLTDSIYSGAVHRNNQAEAYNIIEVAKAECFEGSYAMQKYVTQNCKAENKLADKEKCAEYNKMADLAVKNCDTIFPMETKYDAVLNNNLMQSINEVAIVSENGDILYIGAGEAVATQAHYTPQITAGEVNANGGGDQLLIGESKTFADSTAVMPMIDNQ